MLGDRPTIADVSLAGYLYYPAEEFGFDIGKDHPAIAAWRERVKALPGWVHPYELMPGHPLPASSCYCAVSPPSIANSAPVTKADSSDSR